eukprot:TRINITY_DN45450_c0_g1_i1.p1 TRINITY_DN45450_c0_g1~~TRINITY_DN45450_c0_g1_i1.p1  ORF type:complete len:418 (-),score=55.45 TRINITY_DN45450_c0_g1_i1:93-1268(-)
MVDGCGVADAKLLSTVAPKAVDSGQRVGIRTIRNSRGAAIRIFYPASDIDAQTRQDVNAVGARVPMFRNSFVTYIQGYCDTLLGSRLPSPLVAAIRFCIGAVAWLLPLNRAVLPKCCGADLPVGIVGEGGAGATKQQHPLIVWSHGLTGTGCEHALFAAALALRGNVVAVCHHSDGSSSGCDVDACGVIVRLPYKHPTMKVGEYPTGLRQSQAEYRAQEVEEARSLIMDKHVAGKDLASVIDPSKLVVGGFSFGAATAGLVAATDDTKRWRAAILLDGWWHVNLQNLEVSFDLPTQAHEQGIQAPSLFVGSEEFAGYEKLRDGTKRLQEKVPNKEVHVITSTRHMSFIDVVMWLPPFIAKKLGFVGKDTDPHADYEKIICLVAAFIDKHTA